MPATPFRSHSFTPAPNSGETGIMPDLYQLSIGPIGTAYYQKQFARFETLGKAVPSWNSGAAFCTVAWLLLRKMWRPAALYAGVLIALVLLWLFALHARVPLQVEATVCLITVLLLCVVPGFLANGWLYNQIRTQTLHTLTQANSISQARAQLAAGSATKQQLHMAAAAQTVIGIAFAGLVVYFWNHASAQPRSPAPSGPPALVIPSVASLQVSTPEPAMPTPEPTPSATAPETTSEPEVAVETSLPSTLIEVAPAASAVTALAATTAMTAEPSVSTPSATTALAPSSELAPTAAPTQAKTPVKPVAPKSESKLAAKSTPAAKTTASNASAGRLIPGKYYLNAGVYAQASNVDRSVKQLQAAKLNTLRQTVNSSKGELTRLRIGPFDTRKQAEQAAVTAKRLRINTTVFQQPKS